MSDRPGPTVVRPAAVQLVALLGLVAASTVAVTAIVGLLLALAGSWNVVVTLALGVPAGLAAGWIVVRTGALEAVPVVERSSFGVGLAVVIVVGWTLWAGWSPSEHIVLDRDPASYLTTGLWLADGGSLQADVAEGGLEVLGPDEVAFGGGPVFEVSPGVVEFQFLHTTGVVLAVADSLGGPALALRTPALLAGLGLMAVYLVAYLVTRRPFVSLVPLALLGAGLPLLFVARGTYSEPLGLALLWWTLIAGLILVARPSPLLGVVVGMLFGAAVSVRIDMLIVAAVAVVLVAVAVVSDEAMRRRRAVAFGAAGLAALVPLSVAAVDLVARSGRYATALRSELLASVALVGLAVVIAIVLVVLGGRYPGAIRRILPLPEGVALAAAGVVVVAALFLWLVRPRLGTPVFPPGGPLAGRRTFNEITASWITWYLGPLGAALAVTGVAVAVRRVLRGRGSAAIVAVVAPTLVLGALYLWRPSITPDQLWASRRYVTVVLPGLAVLAALPIAWISGAGWSGRSRPPVRWRSLAAVGVVALCLVPLARSTWPVRELAAQRGYLGVVDEACELMGPDATVLVVNAWASLTVAHAIRATCEVPVGFIGERFDQGSWDRLNVAAAERGRRVVVLATDRGASEAAPWTGDPVVATSTVASPRDPVRSFESLPSRYATPEETAPPGNPGGFTIYLRGVVA